MYGKRFLLLCAAGLAGCFVLAGASVAHAAAPEILTWFSDNSTATDLYPGTTFFAGGSGTFDGQSQDVPAPEGIWSWKTVIPSQSGGYWGEYFPQGDQDLSRFETGQVVFWVYSSNGDVEFDIKSSTGYLYANYITAMGWNSTMTNQWVQLTVPLNGVDLSSVNAPIVFSNGGSGVGVTFYIDDVHYTTSNALPQFNVTIATASQISWSNDLPATWVLADQYISLTVDATTTTWGVQIYTDNTASDANPTYTGIISSTTQTPAGLVDTSSTTQKLDMAWATRPNISTITVVAADPNNGGDPNSFQWIYVEDRAQVMNNQGAIQFQDGGAFVTPLDHVGIHYGQDPSQFGASDPPERIYLEANFANAVTPRTYRTSTLRVEFFTD